MILFLLGVFPLLLFVAFLSGTPQLPKLAPQGREAGENFSSEFAVACNVFRFKAGILGFLAGVIVCAVKALFFFPTRDIHADFFSRFLSTYFDLLFSFIILAAVFSLVFRGELRIKIHSLFFLFSAYFIVMLPYQVLSNVFLLGYFEYCLVPLMYAAMTFVVSVLAAFFYETIVRQDASIMRKIVILCGLFVCFLIVLALPSAAQASRNTGGSSYIVITALFLAFSAALFFLAARITKSYRKDR